MLESEMAMKLRWYSWQLAQVIKGKLNPKKTNIQSAVLSHATDDDEFWSNEMVRIEKLNRL